MSIPIQLYSATEQKDVRFHQFEEGTGKRIRYERVAEGTDREVDYEDIVKGYEVDDGAPILPFCTPVSCPQTPFGSLQS